MANKKIIDESLLAVNGGKWTLDTLTEEEKDRYYEVSRRLTEEWDYVSYNEFINDMNAKYGSNYE